MSAISVVSNPVRLTVTNNAIELSIVPETIEVVFNTGNVTINASSNSVVGEIPNGTIDGSNATFTTDYTFVAGTVLVFYNGLAQYNPTHYITSGTVTITLNFSPAVGDILTVNYDRA